MEAPTQESVWKVLAEYLPLENAAMGWEADIRDTLQSLGATDLTRVEISVALEETFDILVCERIARRWTTVESIVEFVQRRWTHEHGGKP